MSSKSSSKPAPKARAKGRAAPEPEIPKILNVGYGNVLVASRTIHYGAPGL